MGGHQEAGTLFDLKSLREELLAAEDVLNTKYSFDLAEPHYAHCLEIIRRLSAERSDVVTLITSLFASGSLSDEPIAVLMHRLRWPEIREWAENELRGMAHPKVNGRPLEKIIAAYSSDWENRVFYKMFSQQEGRSEPE